MLTVIKPFSSSIQIYCHCRNNRWQFYVSRSWLVSMLLSHCLPLEASGSEVGNKNVTTELTWVTQNICEFQIFYVKLWSNLIAQLEGNMNMVDVPYTEQVHVWVTLWPWRWRQQVASERWYYLPYYSHIPQDPDVRALWLTVSRHQNQCFLVQYQMWGLWYHLICRFCECWNVTV
jgi:hypothetical protein